MFAARVVLVLTILALTLGADVQVWDRCEDWNATLAVRLPTGTCGADGALLELEGDTAAQSGPLQYLWNTGERSATIRVFTAGLYAVTVTDAHKCTVERSVEVAPFPVFTVSISAYGTTCNGGHDGYVGALVRGQAPIRYQWSNGHATEEQTVHAGSYTVTITDARGCTAIRSAVVMQPPPIVVDVDVTDTECVEGHTGSITARVTGGNRPYNRLGVNRTLEETIWHMALQKDPEASRLEELRVANRADDDFSINLDPFTENEKVEGLRVSQLPVGDYVVYVTDTDGCVARTTARVGARRRLEVSIHSKSKCALESPLEARVSGGTPPYTFSWFHQGVPVTDAQVVARAFNNYTVLVRDKLGCVARHTIHYAPLVIRWAPQTPCTGGMLEVLAEGGVRPYSYLWSTGATSASAIYGLADGHYHVLVSDADGCQAALDADVKLNNRPRKLRVQMESTNSSCEGSVGFVRLVPFDGVEPYRYAWGGYPITEPTINAAVGSYTYTVTDAVGCTAPGVVHVHLEPRPKLTLRTTPVLANGTWNSGTVTLNTTNIAVPIMVAWSTGLRGATVVLTNASYGHYSVTVTDRMACSYSLSAFVDEEKDRCPAITNCKRYNLLNTVYLRCLQRISEPMVIDPTQWNVCGARALLLVAEWMSVPATMKDPESSDGGATYTALLVGEAIFSCNARHLAAINSNQTHAPCEMSWHALVPFLSHNMTVMDLFHVYDLDNGRYNEYAFAQYKAEVLELVFGLKRDGADVLTVGPYGFDNEPIFAPSLCRPTRANRVTVAVIKNMRFPSDCLDMAIYPWTVTYDVVVSTAFVRDAIYTTGARWVLPGDSAGILLIGRVGVQMYERERVGETRYGNVLATLERSSPQWPPTYPPRVLSKLVPGHEPFAPAEVVVSDDDGFRTINGNHSRLNEAFAELGPLVVLKDEYSEAGKGVFMVRSGRAGLVPAFDKLFSRDFGVLMLDLNLSGRMFMQRQVRLKAGMRPVGYRFFALQGTVIAAHLSQVEVSTEAFGLIYSTIRHNETEERSLAFVRALNYTGFAAAWWWIDGSNVPYLIDFNARLERHQCLVSTYQSQPEMMWRDPCHVFQQVVANTFTMPPPEELPLMAPAGMRYVDPIRVVRSNKKMYLDLLLSGSVAWNFQRDDLPLAETIRRRLDAHSTEIAAKEAEQRREEQRRVEENTVVVGYTALHAACKRGDLAMVQFLLENGARLADDFDGTTCLHLAAESGNLDLVRLLVEKKVPINGVSTRNHRQPAHVPNSSVTARDV